MRYVQVFRGRNFDWRFADIRSLTAALRKNSCQSAWQTSSSRVILRWAGSAAFVRNQRPASCRAARPLTVSWSTQRAGSLLRKCPARRGSTSQSGAKGA